MVCCLLLPLNGELNGLLQIWLRALAVSENQFNHPKICKKTSQSSSPFQYSSPVVQSTDYTLPSCCCVWDKENFMLDIFITSYCLLVHDQELYFNCIQKNQRLDTNTGCLPVHYKSLDTSAMLMP